MCMQITMIKEEGNLKLRERSQKGSGERSMTLKEDYVIEEVKFCGWKIAFNKILCPHKPA